MGSGCWLSATFVNTDWHFNSIRCRNICGMKFIQLTHDSSVADAKTYLVQLAQSPFHYHLDDSLTEDFHWGAEAPDPETLKVMQGNADTLWWMHLNDILKWDDTWDVYHDAYKDHERKQSIQNNK